MDVALPPIVQAVTFVTHRVRVSLTLSVAATTIVPVAISALETVLANLTAADPMLNAPLDTCVGTMVFVKRSDAKQMQTVHLGIDAWLMVYVSPINTAAPI